MNWKFWQRQQQPEQLYALDGGEPMNAEAMINVLAARVRLHDSDIQRFIAKCGPLEAEQMLRAFAVEEKHPLLLGVMAVLIGLERIGTGNLEAAKLPEGERAFFAGWMACAKEAQDKLAKLVQKGNAAVTGTRAQ